MTKRFKRFFRMSMVLVMLVACTGSRPALQAVRDGQLPACPESPNCVSSQATDERHQIAPLSFQGDPQESFATLKKVLAKRKDTQILSESATSIEVEFHTLLFVDDGQFLLDQEGQVIHVRSASRIGYSDLGQNRKRIEQIRREFSEALADMTP